MPLPSVYVQVYGQVPEFFAKIQEGQAPGKFTQQHLKDIGFTSANHRAFIPLLKAIGFLSADGSPTARYLAYRDASQSRNVMGDALKDAYADLFVIKSHPSDKDRALIEGKFKSAHNVTDRPSELMARTFLALLKLANVDHASALTKAEVPALKSEENDDEQGKSEGVQPEKQGSGRIVKAPALHYNIQIHLPATKDVEVYNAIFKSLREHLVD
jgi:hypothetical protein